MLRDGLLCDQSGDVVICNAAAACMLTCEGVSSTKGETSQPTM